MKCLKTLEQICAELGEDIDSPVCKKIQEHLDQCPKCCAEVDTLRKTVRLYRELYDDDVPKEVDQRLWKVLNLDKPCGS